MRKKVPVLRYFFTHKHFFDTMWVGQLVFKKKHLVTLTQCHRTLQLAEKSLSAKAILPI
jgi:hypothetical protein